MNRSKTWIILIGILLLANVVLLSIFLAGRKDGGKQRQERSKHMGPYLKNEIGFNDTQMAQFDTIRNRHREVFKETFEALRAPKLMKLKQLGELGFSDSAMAEAAKFSAAQQEQIELQMLTHLRDIRNLCTPAQRVKFDTSFYKVMARGKEQKKDKRK